MKERSEGHVKKNDWMLVLGILLLICLSGAVLYGKRSSGRYVSVQVDKERFGRYDLAEDQVIEIKGGNRLEIKDGKAFMVYADCPDQICVETAPVCSTHEVIVCMPNKVIVEILE